MAGRTASRRGGSLFPHGYAAWARRFWQSHRGAQFGTRWGISFRWKFINLVGEFLLLLVVVFCQFTPLYYC